MMDDLKRRASIIVKCHWNLMEKCHCCYLYSGIRYGRWLLANHRGKAPWLLSWGSPRQDVAMTPPPQLDPSMVGRSYLYPTRRLVLAIQVFITQRNLVIKQRKLNPVIQQRHSMAVYRVFRWSPKGEQQIRNTHVKITINF